MTESEKKRGGSPCAACKLLRRRCSEDCVFAPHFPIDQPHKFSNVHKVFGASNVNKMLQNLPVHQRGDAVGSMVYEANARIRDPVYGCAGVISSLQQQIDALQTQLALTQAEVVNLQVTQSAITSNYGIRPITLTTRESLTYGVIESQVEPIFDIDMDHTNFEDSLLYRYN